MSHRAGCRSNQAVSLKLSLTVEPWGREAAAPCSSSRQHHFQSGGHSRPITAAPGSSTPAPQLHHLRSPRKDKLWICGWRPKTESGELPPSPLTGALGSLARIQYHTHTHVTRLGVCKRWGSPLKHTIKKGMHRETMPFSQGRTADSGWSLSSAASGACNGQTTVNPALLRIIGIQGRPLYSHSAHGPLSGRGSWVGNTLPPLLGVGLVFVYKDGEWLCGSQALSLSRPGIHHLLCGLSN